MAISAMFLGRPSSSKLFTALGTTLRTPPTLPLCRKTLTRYRPFPGRLKEKSSSFSSSKIRCCFSSMRAYMRRRVSWGVRGSYSVGWNSPSIFSMGGRPTVITRSLAPRSTASAKRSTTSGALAIAFLLYSMVRARTSSRVVIP